jgi:hypothetical protein
MKTLIAVCILVTGFATCANAQTTLKPEDIFKLKPFKGMDSLSWHMPKTPDALKLLPSPQQPANSEIVAAWASNSAIITYSTMPVAHIGGGYSMPNMQLISPDKKMVKQVIVINPLAAPAKP